MAPRKAPGDAVVRLRAVRVRTQEGTVSEAFDIRRPIGVDVIFDVLEGGKQLSPNIHIFNAEGLTLFISIDQDKNWHHRSRPAGRYKSTCWIPGISSPKAHLLWTWAITTFVPMDVHFHERSVVGFEVIDSIDGDSVRGDYG